MSGGRKRKAVGMSGGWLARVLESRRSPWKQPRRRGKPVKHDMVPKDIKYLSSNVHLTDENIQVDMVEAVKSMQVRMLEGVMVSEQKNELPVTTVKSAVLCQSDENSDKDFYVFDYWAQEGMLAGAGGQREDLQGLQHHQHGGEGKEPHEGPGHVVQDDIGHMEDVPGKANQLFETNFSVAWLVGQGAAAGEQGEGAGDAHCVGHAAEGGGSDGLQQLQLQRVHGHLQEQVVHLHHAEVEGGQAGAADGPHQRDGGGGHGGVQGGGWGGVQARVKDGFGGGRVKRSYWKRKVIPDGLVQSRIDQFSTVLPKIGGGEGGRNSLEHEGTNGRKRKFARE